MLDEREVHSCIIFPFLIEASLSIYHSYLNVHVHNITQLMSCVHVANNRPKNKDLWMLKTCCFILPPFQNKRYVWWNFSQTSPNELECCKKQCKCCCWWNIMSNNILRFGAIRPKWRASSEISAKCFRLYYGHPQLARKHLVRVMQRTQFRAKNDLIKPT